MQDMQNYIKIFRFLICVFPDKCSPSIVLCTDQNMSLPHFVLQVVKVLFISSQMQMQLENMAKLNADIRRRTSQTQQRSQTLITDKAELETQIRDKEQQIQIIKEQLHQDSQERHASVSDLFNPLSPHDALKHHFISLKSD